MAGLGFKDFAVGEVLTSSDVDGYLMQQTVMRFADSGARGSALGTATGAGTALAEGMVSYLDDTNTLAVYDGGEWSPVGRIVQIQTATTATTTSNTTTTPAATALSLTFTPKYSDSTIIVMAQASRLFLNTTGGSVLNWELYADASAVAATNSLSANVNREQSIGMLLFVDEPGSTSARVYQPYIWRTADPVVSCEVSGRQNLVAFEVKS